MGYSIYLIRTTLKSLLLVGLVLALSTGADAAKKKSSKRKKTKGQWGMVLVDGAAVYQVPNFDSPILEYLDRDKKIRVSKKLYNGIGGLGAFYKVRLGKKRYGYITDVDLRLKTGKYPSPKNNGQPSQGTLTGDSDPFGKQVITGMDQEEPEDLNSIYFTRFFGMNYSSYNYSETINKTALTGATSFFGFKMTGPGAFIGGAPMDVEVLYSSGPSFYDDVYSDASGFLLIFNTLLLLPAMEWKNALIYYGAGIVLTYSLFDINTLQDPDLTPLKAEEVRAGAAFSLGGAYRVGGNWLLRGEAKYFYEAEKYFGLGASIQHKW